MIPRSYLLAAFSALIISVGSIAYMKPEVLGLDTIARRKAVSRQVRLLVERIKLDENNSIPLSELITLAKSKYSFGATIATIAIGDLGDDAAPAVFVLGESLESNDPYVSRAAAISLGRLGRIAKSQLPKLEEVLSDHDVDMFKLTRGEKEFHVWFAKTLGGYPVKVDLLERGALKSVLEVVETWKGPNGAVIGTNFMVTLPGQSAIQHSHVLRNSITLNENVSESTFQFDVGSAVS